MTAPVKIIAFAGSTRKESFNKKLVKLSVKGAEAAGAKVTFVDLKDYPMPLYDGDLEAAEGLPLMAQKLKALFEEHQGFLIASPEYNSGYSAVLKNTIDWVSRPSAPGAPSLTAFTGKYAALMSAAPGALGGLRGLYQLRELLQNINVTVMPKMQSVGQAAAAFTEQNTLKDEKMAQTVEKIGADLAKLLQRLST